MIAEIEKTIFGKFNENLAQENPGIEITRETAIGDLAMDSLAIFELIYELEDQFHVTLDDYELSSMDTVGDVIMLVQQAHKAPV